MTIKLLTWPTIMRAVWILLIIEYSKINSCTITGIMIRFQRDRGYAAPTPDKKFPYNKNCYFSILSIQDNLYELIIKVGYYK